jgi:hypothetical protein
MCPFADPNRVAVRFGRVRIRLRRAVLGWHHPHLVAARDGRRSGVACRIDRRRPTRPAPYLRCGSRSNVQQRVHDIVLDWVIVTKRRRGPDLALRQSQPTRVMRRSLRRLGAGICALPRRSGGRPVPTRLGASLMHRSASARGSTTRLGPVGVEHSDGVVQSSPSSTPLSCSPLCRRRVPGWPRLRSSPPFCTHASGGDRHDRSRCAGAGTSAVR